MVFWVYLGSPSYQRGGGGREREEMALLPLSCMRSFDPAATRQFFRAPAAALTRKCQEEGPPSEKRTEIRRVQSLGGVGGGRRRRRDLLHRPPARLRRADPQKVEAINRNRHLHLTFRSPARQEEGRGDRRSFPGFLEGKELVWRVSRRG